MNLYGDEIRGRTIDLTFDPRRWLVGVHVNRWKFLTGQEHDERTIRVYIGPLCLTTWRASFR